jgi:hypothetical protein
MLYERKINEKEWHQATKSFVNNNEKIHQKHNYADLPKSKRGMR